MERWRKFRNKRLFQEKDLPSGRAGRGSDWRVSSRLVAILVAMLTFGLASWFFYWSDYFTVRRIAVDGDVSEPVIREVGTLVGRHIFYVDESELYRALVVLDPALESVEIARGIPDQLQITVRRRTPVLALERAGQRWGIDEAGIVFALPTSTDELPKVIDLRPSLEPQAGEHYLTPVVVGWLSEAFRAHQVYFGEPLREIVISEHVRLVDLVTSRGWSIRADTARAVSGQFETVALILRDHGDKVHEYLDIRVNGWGYLK